MKRIAICLSLSALLFGCQAAPSVPATQASKSLDASSKQPAALARSEDVQPPTGHACRVYLRRDALGIPGAATPGAALEIPLQHGTVVGGILEQVTDSWLVLRTDSGRLWVPRGMVLMVELPDR